MNDRLKFRVDEELDGVRLDIALARSPGAFSRRKAKWLITQGSVFIDGKRCRVCARPVTTGAEIEVTTTERPPEVHGSPEILFVDDEALFVAKPSGMPTAPTQQAATGTLTEHLKATYGELFLVHRLDAATSGVVCLARTKAFAQTASRAFREHRPVRKYLAIVHGAVPFDAHTISLPIAKVGHGQFTIDDQLGKPAETNVTTLLRSNDRSLLLVAPKTGRAHQIRLHLAALGHPVVGDPIYGERGPLFCLHALFLMLDEKAALAAPSEAFLNTAEASGFFRAAVEVSYRHYAEYLPGRAA